MNYAGVKNAAVFTFNRVVIPGTTNTPAVTNYVVSGSGGYVSTNGARGGLANNLGNDVERGYRGPLGSVLRKSLIAVTDGNPAATTALLAEQTFEEFAAGPQEQWSGMQARIRAGATTASGASLQAAPSVGVINAGSFHGTTYSLPLTYRRRLSTRVGLSISLPLNYVEVEDAEVYRAGVLVGVPVRVVGLAPESCWLWQVTLSGGCMAGVSSDLLDGAVVEQGAVSSALTGVFGPCRLTMGNQFSLFETTPIAGYSTSLSQQLLKNGLRFEVPWRPNWTLQLWAIHTRFVQTAALQDYATVGGTMAWRTPPGWPLPWMRGGTLNLGAYSHFGTDYRAPHFRIGTEWKF